MRKEVPPEVFFGGEGVSAFEGEGLDEVVVFVDALDSSPEVEELAVVFHGEFTD